jgi:hypothetical protein
MLLLEGHGPSDTAVFAGLRRERIEVRSVLPVEGRPDSWPGLVQPRHERSTVAARSAMYAD